MKVRCFCVCHSSSLHLHYSCMHIQFRIKLWLFLWYFLFWTETGTLGSIAAKPSCWVFLCSFSGLLNLIFVFRSSLDENKSPFLYLYLYLDAISLLLFHQRRGLDLSVLVKVIWLAPYYGSNEKQPYRFLFSKDEMWSLHSCNSPGGRLSEFSLGVVHSCLFQPGTI